MNLDASRGETPAPSKSKLQLEVEGDGGLGNTVRTVLLRKCCVHDCRRDGKWSFREALPDGSVRYHHAYCDRMDCWHCARRKLDILSTKLSTAISSRGLLYCYSLTVPSRVSREEGFQLAMEALKPLKARFQRRFKRPMAYIAVKSLGDGWRHRPHVHLLLDTKLEYRWLKETWAKHAKSFNVRRRVNMWGDIPRLNNYMVNNWLGGYVHGLRGKKVTTSAGIDIAVKPAKPKEQRRKMERLNQSTRDMQMLHHGGKVWDYPENPRQVLVVPDKAERSEVLAPPAAPPGRRADGPEGTGRTRGVYAAGGPSLSDLKREAQRSLV